MNSANSNSVGGGGGNSPSPRWEGDNNGLGGMTKPPEVNHNQGSPPRGDGGGDPRIGSPAEQTYLLQTLDGGGRVPGPGGEGGGGGGGGSEKLPFPEPDGVVGVTNSITLVKDKDMEVDVENADRDDNRETWGKKIDFLLSIIGFAVDLANVWRFPYLCYKNGGGAFLVPYFLMLTFGAIPLFFMELILGQFHRLGAVSVWKIAPIFKGIGLCQCLIAYYVAFYYNVIIAWSVYFLVASFTRQLPWTSCGHSYNTLNCSEGFNITQLNSTSNNHTVSSAAEYFERGVLGLQLSDGLDDLGAPRWQLVLCLLAVFLILYLSLWKGVKSSGKVVWVTATMPYVVLLILLIRGVMLPGAGSGIMYFITPNLSRLGDSQVWIDAAIQIFYSCGAGFGVHIAYASYNKFNNNVYRDCLITVGVNSFTSILSGCVIFSYLGYMAASQGKSIENVATEGPGLVFVVYPEAIATLPGSVAWSIIFFIMLITLGLDSAMGGLEAVLTSMKDELHVWINKCRFGREILTAVVCFSAFLFALQNVTNGGMYLFTMWDAFAAGTSILFGVFSLVVAVAWFYGLRQFCDDIEKMLGFRPNFYWRICWKFISPTALLVIIIASFATFKPLSYTSYTMGTYTYPTWSSGVAWVIGCSSMALIPGAAIVYLLRTPGPWKQRIALGISPVWEHRAIKRGEIVRRFKKEHWTYM